MAQDRRQSRAAESGRWTVNTALGTVLTAIVLLLVVIHSRSCSTEYPPEVVERERLLRELTAAGPLPASPDSLERLPQASVVEEGRIRPTVGGEGFAVWMRYRRTAGRAHVHQESPHDFLLLRAARPPLRVTLGPGTVLSRPGRTVVRDGWTYHGFDAGDLVVVRGRWEEGRIQAEEIRGGSLAEWRAEVSARVAEDRRLTRWMWAAAGVLAIFALALLRVRYRPGPADRTTSRSPAPPPTNR